MLLSAGGIILKGYGSRITVNNTLEERLRLLEERVSSFVLVTPRTIEADDYFPLTDASRDP